jgi:predicted DNA-binding transcriptional regulator YafY
MAIALRGLAGTPFRAAAGSALRKLVAAMQADDAAAAHDLAGRIHLMGDDAPPAVPRAVADAVSAGRVLRIGYADRAGTATVRDVEPMGFVGKQAQWYLVAWCRLRDEVRAFRLDRIASVAVTAEVPAPRPLHGDDLHIPYGVVRRLSLT